jgi:hypothetical protein
MYVSESFPSGLSYTVTLLPVCTSPVQYGMNTMFQSRIGLSSASRRTSGEWNPHVTMWLSEMPLGLAAPSIPSAPEQLS